MRILWENIVIPIKVGDTVLGGKFKNKRIVVKSIDKNEKGDITINGKPLLKFRLLSESVNFFFYLSFKKRFFKNRKAHNAVLSKLNDKKKAVYLEKIWEKYVGTGFGKEIAGQGMQLLMMLKDDKYIKEAVLADKIECDNCGHTWLKVEGGNDLYRCHECGHDNTPYDAAGKTYKRLNIGESNVKEIYYDNQGNPCKHPTTLDGRCLDKNYPSHKREPLSEIPMADLQKIDKFADKKLNPVDVVITDKHFFDRLNDPRNDKEISSAELIGFFKRLAKKKKEFLDFLDRYKQVVASDDRTNINIPFMKQANKVIAKTVMRKKDFKTQNQKVEI